MKIRRTVTLYISAVLVALSSSVSVQASSFYESNNILYYNPQASDAITCSPSQIGPIPGEDNLQKIYNFFLAKGTSKKVAAAIVGNIYQESKGDPLLLQGGGRTEDPSNVGLYADGSRFRNEPGDTSVGKAWGILQWDPGNAALYWQEQSGVEGDISQLGTQLEITWWHLNNLAPTSKRNILAKMEAAADVNEATSIMVSDFFGAGKPHLENRQKAAAIALSYPIDPSIAATLASTSSTSSCNNYSGGPLAEGGLNEEQAKQFMMNYGENKNDSSKAAAGAASWNLCNGGGSNCVTFSQFFLNKFAGINDFGLPDGRAVVRHLGSKGMSTGSEPRLYATFSWTGGEYGHTGIVLGIHGDTIIVGHASCSNNGTGRGDGTSLAGAGFIRVGKKDDSRTWYGKVPTEFAYPENVDTQAIEQYLSTGV